MPVFKDRSAPVLLPEGDYVYCVVEFEIGLSNGAKTKGSEKYELELEIEPSGKKVFENLIDHDSTAWKIDNFLKSAGVPIAKDEEFDFNEVVAKDRDIRWVNPIGLRGWCHLVQETLPGKTDDDKKAIAAGTKKATVVNKVSTFYTDRPKLEPRAAVPEEEKPF